MELTRDDVLDLAALTTRRGASLGVDLLNLPSLGHVGDVFLFHDCGRSRKRRLHLLLRALLLSEFRLGNLLDGPGVHRRELLRGFVEVGLVVHGRRAHELALILEEPLGEILVVVSGVLVVRVVDDSILYTGKQSEKKKRQPRIRNVV